MRFSDCFPGRRGRQPERTNSRKKAAAAAFFRSLAAEGLSDGQLFARILEDPEAFEHAVAVNRLHALIPELCVLEENPPDQDPNIYRPMPLVNHMREAIRQTFGWVGNFGADEYTGADAKRYALLWINAALLFHDLGEIAILKGTHLPLWYHFTVEWPRWRIRNILRETYPFFGMDTPEGRSYINHLRHPEISAALAGRALSRLGWDSPASRIVEFLVRNHSVLIEQATYGRLKDGRILHDDVYKEIVSVTEKTGVSGPDLLKMLQVVQIMDATAVKPGMAQIPQETMMRVWMAYTYMAAVLEAGRSPRRHKAFVHYRKVFSRIRKEMPFGTPFGTTFAELISRIGQREGALEPSDRALLEQELEYFEKFEIIREDHIHINNQFNRLLHLIERMAGGQLPPAEKGALLQAYKIAYRSHDGQFRRAFKIIPTGDKRRKFIEHPIRVAKILVDLFGVTDPRTIATVMLHDVLEDTDIHVDDIRAAFHSYDPKGRINSALAVLTKPESRRVLKRGLEKDLAYFAYVARVLTAGDTVLDDRELFEWLRFVLPRAKAADKIHNRRSLAARKVEGRIKEICRNANTLVMFMESSNLTPEEKLKVLEEFDRSLLDIFRLPDFREEANARRFRAALSEFARLFCGHEAAGREFGPALETLPDYLGDPDAMARELGDLEKALPALCRASGLDRPRTTAVLDAFAFFLFQISEANWITDKGKRTLIRFQEIVRRYKEQITAGGWEPEYAGIIEDLARYAQGYEDAPAPVIRISRLPDIRGLASPAACLCRWPERLLAGTGRRLVARLLPRVAMLPLKDIYWLGGRDVHSVDRRAVEGILGGIGVRKRSGRVVLTIHPHLIRSLLEQVPSRVTRAIGRRPARGRLPVRPPR